MTAARYELAPFLTDTLILDLFTHHKDTACSSKMDITTIAATNDSDDDDPNDNNDPQIEPIVEEILQETAETEKRIS